MAEIKITPVKAEDVVPTRAARSSEWDEVVKAIDALPSKAAKFLVEKVDKELDSFKRTFRRSANAINKTAVFGADEAVDGGTHVTVKLTEKQPGRPVGAVNAPVVDADAK